VINRLIRTGDFVGDGSDVKNFAVAARDHFAQVEFGQDKVRAYIELQHIQFLLQIGLHKFSEQPLRRVIDQYINAPADRNITNPNTPEYLEGVSNRESTSISSTESTSVTTDEGSATIETESNSVSSRETSNLNNESSTMAASSEVDGTVHFEPNSVTLTESAERQLKQVVDQLDKSAPVALTVELQGTYSSEGDISSSSSSTTLGQDSSAGLPMDERGLAGGGVSPAERSGMPGNAPVPSKNTEALEREAAERAVLISRYRAENIRQYLERQGIEVVEWNMEGEVSSAAGGTSSDAGFATSNPAAQQSAEEVQQVRIVVIGDVQPEGLSAL